MKTLIKEFIETAILAMLIFLSLQLVVQNFRVEGYSMTYTLEQGQYLLVNKLVYLKIDPGMINRVLPFLSLNEDKVFYPFHPPYRGDIIIFRYPEDESRDFVKRVIGIPRDVVEVRRGQVYVNGEPLHEPYITSLARNSIGSVIVPRDSYYVLGDNRLASNDSRDWGMVPAENIIGRAWVSYWPLDQLQALSLFRRP